MRTKPILIGLGCCIFLGCVFGCGDDPTTPPITAPQAQEAGATIADQVASLTDAFTFESFADVPIRKAASLLPAASPWRNSLMANRLLEIAADSCATFSDTTDTDGDGVPNSLTVHFDQPGCTHSDENGTATLSGSFHISDPGTTAGFDIAYSNVRLRLDATNGDYIDFDLNGTQGVSATTTSASLNENVTLVIAARSGMQTANARIGQNWTAGFTAASGQTFEAGAPLPDGALTVSGSSTWSSGSQNFAFTVSTQSPLQHESSCTTSPTFAAGGELHALVSGNQGGAFIRIQFVGCGQDPIVTLVGRPAL